MYSKGKLELYRTVREKKTVQEFKIDGDRTSVWSGSPTYFYVPRSTRPVNWRFFGIERFSLIIQLRIGLLMRIKVLALQKKKLLLKKIRMMKIAVNLK